MVQPSSQSQTRTNDDELENFFKKTKVKVGDGWLFSVDYKLMNSK
jgi:hypothetical protein